MKALNLKKLTSWLGGQRRWRWSKLSRRQKRGLLYVAAGLAGLYVILTLATWGLYQHKFFPRSVYSGQLVGNSGFSEESLKRRLPENIKLSTPTGSFVTTPASMGIRANPQVTLETLKKERRLRPFLVFKLVQRHRYPLGIDFEEKSYVDFLGKNLSRYERNAENARLVVKGETVKVEAAKPGNIVSYRRLKDQLRQQIGEHPDSVTVPFETSQANIQAADLQPKADALNAALDQTVTINYNGGRYNPTRAEKAAWLTPSGNELAFDKTVITNFLNSLQGRLGQSWDNQSTVAAQISEKLAANSAVSVTMHDRPRAVRTYRYCVALKNVDGSLRGSFAAKIASTLNAARGWSLNGKIAFAEASSGCDFTIWLAAADTVPGFGPSICDAYYSCAVSPNVIINADRWLGATPPWNAAGGSLEDYRVMVINHEVGHWLGFGHRNCPGTGQPAPVMQQQSISLQGCSFNPWPTASELSTLAQTRGV